MASVKDLFRKALGYTKFQIVETKELIAETEETLSYLLQGSKEEQAQKSRYIYKRQEELRNLKQELKRLETILKHDMNYFGYSQEEVDKAPIPTQEELDKEYEQECKQAEKENANYNYMDLINMVKEFEKGLQVA